MPRDLTGRALFRAVAPTLERAHRERLVELAEERELRIWMLARLQEAERRVAHRDLQYHRACSRRRSAVYIEERWQKLQAAVEELRRVEDRARRFGLHVPKQRRAA